MNELKPCPFCGGEVEHQIMWDGAYSFTCSRCGLNARFTDDIARAVPEALEETERLWNERHKRTCHMVFNNPLTDDNCKCDSCGCTFDLLRGVGWISGRYDYLWSYCANCGAEVLDDDTGT